MTVEKTCVLIVGGSLVGLSTALFLALHGVPCVLVEPHIGSHPHPRAIGYTSRTLEILHTAGIELPEVPRGFRLSRARVESLAGKWHDATEWTPKKPAADTRGARNAPSHDDAQGQAATPANARSRREASPYYGAAIAQDVLEPKLRDGARARGAELRLGTELVRFSQDEDGVTAVLRERDNERGGGHGSEREYELRADYMVACDGNRSTVREALGIPRRGPGLLQVMRSVLFRAPLQEYLAKGISQFEIEQPETDGRPALSAFLTTYGDGRWVLMFKDDVERDEATLRAAIEQAVGRNDLPVEILTTGRWELTALVAERFREGRVFLAGDAAHTLPPTRGGYGANTGIHDAHNLAWKLKAALNGALRDSAEPSPNATPRGSAEPSPNATPRGSEGPSATSTADALLDTYDAERRPVAWTRLEQTFARPDYAAFARGFADGVEILDETAIELGQLYRTLADDPSLPDAARPDEWRGQPGTRAPHVWLDGDDTIGRPLGTPTSPASTLDWFGHGWVLVAADDAWRAEHAASIHTTIAASDITVVHANERVREAFGLTPTGAALVRPDGYIAWRRDSAARS